MTGTNVFCTLSPSNSLSYNDEYYYCDYVELLALVNNKDFLSISDVIQRFFNELADEKVGEGCAADITQKWELRVGSWFEILGGRNNAYGNSYPFIVNEGRISLKLDLEGPHFVYLFMLLCANQHHIDTRARSLLTTEFEMIAHRALLLYLPDISKAYRCGKSSLPSDRYTGHVTKKIEAIARDINMSTQYDEEDFASTDNGDFGLDLVAWTPFKDDICKRAIDVYLVQCATGKNWLSKQHEARKIENCIPRLRGNNVDVIFVPYDARRGNRDFQDTVKLTASLVFDRFRIFGLLTHGDTDWIYKCKDIVNLINRAVSYQEDLV